MQQRAGITLAHLKKLKQAISVIVCLKKRIQREERKSDGASSHQLPEDPQAQQGEEEGGGGLRPDAHDGLEVAREGGSGVALGAVPRLNLEAMENGAGRGGSDHLPPLDEDACRGLTETEKDHTQAEGPNSPSWREALAPWSMASPRDTTPGREAPRLDSSQAPRAAEGAGAPLSLRKDGSGQYGKAPRPKRQQEESPFPDHSYVTGFATHREPGRFMVEHRLKPDFQEMYGISFVPEGQKPWTPRGGLSAAPGTRQNAWTPISRSTRRSRSTPGSVPLLPTLPRARVALAGGWYTNRSHEVKGSPLLEEGVPVQTAAGRIRLNDEHSHTGVAKSADGNRFVLRPRCFSDTIIVS